ncbi:hypothetical protein HY620_00145 [Candidatus Uhrbacteria bacterium]|nr:hypothetical protein [Candidatus Uhrbacteria bacterium]
MRISKKVLFSLRVVTQSGIYLGRIVDCVIDCDMQSILQYRVRQLLSRNELLIHRDQVVSITERQMIVEDAVAREHDKKPARKGLPKIADMPS